MEGRGGNGGEEVKMGVKRLRGGGSQRAKCLVQGCESDLSNCKEYHRRHKVCEEHSKTPVVIVGGQQQRFCQQCSRFHLLGEFDDEKRSCRKRLDGHNKRRRKPPPLSTSAGLIPSPGLGFYSCENTFSPCTSLQSKHTANAESPVFASSSVLHFNESPQQSIFPTNYKAKYFPFLQDSNATVINVHGTTLESTSLLSHNTISSSEHGNCNTNTNTNEIFANSLTQVLNPNSAPSLLSSPIQTSTIDLYNIVPGPAPADHIPFGQPSSGSSKYPCPQITDHLPSTAFSCLDVETENVGSVLFPNARNIDESSPNIFHVGKGMSPDGPFQTVPFSWS